MSIESIFLEPVERTHSVNEIVADAQRVSTNKISFINQVGKIIIKRFWLPQPEFTQATDITERMGVYFNGENIAEFYEQIRHDKIPFWREYSSATGILDPNRLMEAWLIENNRSSYKGQRTATEILEHRYIGEGTGCQDYVKAMADVLRVGGVPVKIIFFLKQDESLEEIERVADRKDKGVGHYMGACFVEGIWRLYDFKYQWNSKYASFYVGSESGLQTLVHRENDRILYVPVTNNGIYTPEESISSDNIGFSTIKDRPNIVNFAQDFLQKLPF